MNVGNQAIKNRNELGKKQENKRNIEKHKDGDVSVGEREASQELDP